MSLLLLLYSSVPKFLSDTLTPPRRGELLGTFCRSVTLSRRSRQSRWLRPVVFQDNCGAVELLLPQARVQADYDVPARATGSGCSSRRRTLAGPGRRYVSEVGYSIREPKAMGCMFMLPTMSL
jgi:hypothetical protein